MADVIGPCSTLPGAIHNVPDSTNCDQHEDRKRANRANRKLISDLRKLGAVEVLSNVETHVITGVAFKPGVTIH